MVTITSWMMLKHSISPTWPIPTNNIQLYLRITTLSEIMDHTEHCILPSFFHRNDNTMQCPNPSGSTLQWPTQPCPKTCMHLPLPPTIHLCHPPFGFGESTTCLHPPPFGFKVHHMPPPPTIRPCCPPLASSACQSTPPPTTRLQCTPFAFGAHHLPLVHTTRIQRTPLDSGAHHLIPQRT